MAEFQAPIPKVIVVIIPDGAFISRSSSLKSLFLDPIFEVVELNQTGPYIRNFRDEGEDKKIIFQALQLAYDMDPTSNVLLLKNTSVSVAAPDLISQVIKDAIQVPGWDLFYLCNWNDRCQLHRPVPLKEIDDGKLSYIGRYNNDPKKPYSMFRTFSAGGLQAILYSNDGIKRILSAKNLRNGGSFNRLANYETHIRENVESGNLRSYCFYPNIFCYDISLNAITNSDYAKLNYQRIETETSQRGSNTQGVILTFLLLLLMLILTWLLVRTINSKRRK